MTRARAPRDASTRSRRSRPTPRWLSTKTDLDAIAKNRVMLVLSVLSGEKPVTTAIEDAQISRGFYYQLETKALNAMLLALAPGSDGDSSPDATGLTARIAQLEEKLARAEAAQRRAERLLFLQRKLSPGAVKTSRGRPPKSTTKPTTTPSTPAGRRSWRSSMTEKPTTQRTQRSTSKKTSSSTSTTTEVPAGTSATTGSIRTPAGEDAAPSAGSENSRAPSPRATT